MLVCSGERLVVSWVSRGEGSTVWAEGGILVVGFVVVLL